MFNTLGNLYANPKCGLLFIDFGTGTTLQLTGEASIIWDQEIIADFPAAERVVHFQVKKTVYCTYTPEIAWELISYSPHNPL